MRYNRGLCILLLVLLVASSGASSAAAYEVTSDYYYYPVEEAVPDDSGTDDDGIVLYSSHSIPAQYGVGTSQIAVFEGLVSKLPYGTHYVYWRDGQYNFRLAYSADLQLSGTTFQAPSVRIVSYNTYSSSGSQATYTASSEAAFILSAGSYMVWSDLGDYPDLFTGRGGRDYAHAACFGIAVICVYYCLNVLRRSCRL